MLILIVLPILIDFVVNAAPRTKRLSYARPSQAPISRPAQEPISRPSQYGRSYQQPQHNYNSEYQQPRYYRGRCDYCRSDSYYRQPPRYERPRYTQYSIQYPDSYENIHLGTPVVLYDESYGNQNSRYRKPTSFGRHQNIPYSLPRYNNNFPIYVIRPEETYHPQVNRNDDYAEQNYENQPIESSALDLPKPKPRLLEKIVTTEQPLAQIPEEAYSMDEESKQLGKQIGKSADKPQVEVPVSKVVSSNHVVSARFQPTSSQLKPLENIRPSMVVDGESISNQDNTKNMDDVLAPTRTMSPEVYPPGWDGQDRSQLSKSEGTGHESPPFWPPRDEEFHESPDHPPKAHAVIFLHRGPPGL